MSSPSWRQRAERAATLASTLDVTEHQLRYALSGVQYPVQRWQLVTWAQFNGCGWLILPRLSELPQREYADFHDVWRELTNQFTPRNRPPSMHRLAEKK